MPAGVERGIMGPHLGGRRGGQETLGNRSAEVTKLAHLGMNWT